MINFFGLLPYFNDRFFFIVSITQDASGKASKRTFIIMYDMKTRELTTLFVHDYVIHVVSCSINEERTLLGTLACSANMNGPVSSLVCHSVHNPISVPQACAQRHGDAGL